MSRASKKRVWNIPDRGWRGSKYPGSTPGKSQADRTGDDDHISEADLLEVLAANADAICYRCKVRFKDHRDADHLFFEELDEAPDEEFN